ncbi:Mur ligase family protein [Candidatus Gottesmanbacteria bacterium]|nr:Mur ligase family protein [Candidatus Gottesmanbacteria bacterium]
MFFSIIFGKLISFVSQLLNLGAGATWPGEIALRLDPHILTKIAPKNIILVAGTNGKTTTTLMIKQILGDRVVTNASGANLLNGMASAIITSPPTDWGVFEIDENSLPQVLHFIKPKVIVLLNLFRDQLDRYGEVDVIAEKWERSLREQGRQREQDSKASKKNTIQIIANADDPLVAEIAKSASRPGLEAGITFFGLDDPSQFMKKMEHATDSTFCPRCGTRLIYKGIYYSHLGDWHCPKCKNTRPKLAISSWDYPLPGLYNRYNTLAAVATAKALGVSDKQIKLSLQNFAPAFGRQEEFTIDGKKVKIFLSKNPAGFNESLRTVIELGAKNILIALNDRIPDGRDVSWIWDVDFEMLPGYVTPVVSGDRCYDLALRLKYAKPYQKLPGGAVSEPQTPIIVYEELETALRFCLSNPDQQTPLYILPTYSAMLEVRKILTGKKIL